jgi:glycosyltransferase involved in cell wall biosynthesis
MHRCLRIAIVSRADASGGGAGRIADELAAGLSGAGHRVLRVYRRGAPARSGDVVRIPAVTGEMAMRNLVHVDLGAAPLLGLLASRRVDVVHFHDHHMAWGIDTARLAAGRWPTVLTLHDFSGFTGGCMYPGGCQRFETGCGACPELGHDALPLRLDTTARTWRVSARLAATPGVVAVAPSRYLAGLAQRGAWRGRRVDVIPNGVDVSTFVPGRREPERARRGLAGHERALIFVASTITDPRKGLADLVAAVTPMLDADPALRVWLVGRPGEWRDVHPRLEALGPVHDKAALADLYAAADLLVIPSHEDNLPCTVAESLACGTPVVGYPTGGIPEMVEPATSGWIASARTAEALREAIGTALAHLPGSRARLEARARAEREYHPGTFVARHLDLYLDALAGRRA